ANAWERGIKWVRRQPALAALVIVGLVAVLALAGAAVGLFVNSRLQEANSRLEAAVADAQSQRAEADKQRALARRYLYVAQLNLAAAAWQRGQLAQVQELLERQRPRPPVREDLRGFEWHYLRRQSLSRERYCLDKHSAVVTSAAYSPDGQHLASASDDR